MSKPKPAPLPAGTVVGGYQGVRKLAAGGFGVVYLAEDPEQRLVAIKEYLPASLAERSTASKRAGSSSARASEARSASAVRDAACA